MDTTKNNPVLSSSTIVGTNVYNTHEDKLGDIKDIMIDTSTGTISYAVLSVSDGLFSHKYFAVPFEAMRFDTDRERILIDVNENWLENAPGFDKDNWPNTADKSFVNDVHTYYETKPFHEQRANVAGDTAVY